jgi:pimeloyl-ACP methyl ester carboxylesterase
VQAEWIPIGRTPLEQVRVPFGATRVRITREGYAPFEGALSPQSAAYTLDPAGAVPDGMVRVAGGTTSVSGTAHQVPDFWMDRFEITNRQFKAFVDAGGYRNREYWTQPIVERERTLPWEEAMARLLDRTGRPGPSTWELGTFPGGGADLPVSGVSWHEAAAYARYAGKRLPSAFQWRAAVSWGVFVGGIFSDILEFSNFGMKGPAVVGSHAGIGPFGTYDMAGNVKEWCWNETAGGRMILGGGWNETSYKYLDIDAQPPLNRGPAFGFRLVSNIAPPPDASYAAIPATPPRDYSKEKPADDATFAILRGLYSYDPQPLGATVDRVEETPEWRRETVTLDAPYGGERLIVHVYLPKNAAPPFQSVIYFPGGDAPTLRSSRELRLTAVDFIPRAGRALLFPVYKGTFERRVEAAGPNVQRDIVIASVKDFRRVVEFVGSRPDLDRERIGFYGDSRGAWFGVISTAVEKGLKASVLLGVGLPSWKGPPEVDLFNFAPRIEVPTLMVGGRSDFLAPVETGQTPLFRALGVPPEHKKHALFDGGHAPSQFAPVIREILDWFDRYLGPVMPLSP